MQHARYMIPFLPLAAYIGLVSTEKQNEAQSRNWVLITGVNTGLGYQLAVDLLREGRPVIAACRTQKKADVAAATLKLAVGPDSQVQPLVLDVADHVSIHAAVQQLRRDFDQRLEVLVNNAGVNTMSWSQRAWDVEFAANFDGPVLLAEQLAPLLREGAGGRVVNVSSSLGQLNPEQSGYGGVPSQQYRNEITAATSLSDLRQIKFRKDDVDMAQSLNSSWPLPIYRATKAMLNKATQLLAADERLRSHNVSVCAVCPGSCKSNMNPIAERSTREGAASIAWCISCDDPDRLNGKFWRDGQELSF